MKNLVNDIIAANQRIKAVDGGARETPLDESGVFSDRTGVSFLLKGEHLQRTGSFKMRGAMNKVLCMSRSGSMEARFSTPRSLSRMRLVSILWLRPTLSVAPRYSSTTAVSAAASSL